MFTSVHKAMFTGRLVEDANSKVKYETVNTLIIIGMEDGRYQLREETWHRKKTAIKTKHEM